MKVTPPTYVAINEAFDNIERALNGDRSQLARVKANQSIAFLRGYITGIHTAGSEDQNFSKKSQTPPMPE